MMVMIKMKKMQRKDERDDGEAVIEERIPTVRRG